MAITDDTSRSFAWKRSIADPFHSVRRAAYLVALVTLLWSTGASAQGVPANCPADLPTADIINHDFSVSFCELCGVGTVRLVIENPYRRQDDADFSDLVITEDLLSSGLTYVPGTTRFTASNVAPPPVIEPIVSGPNGSVLTWVISNASSWAVNPDDVEAIPPGGACTSQPHSTSNTELVRSTQESVIRPTRK